MPNESAEPQSFDLYNFREHFGKAFNAIEFPSYLIGYDIRFLIKTILRFLLSLESQLEQIPITEEVHLQFQKIFLSDWDDSYHRINNLEFETNLQTQLIFHSGNHVGIINLDPLIKFLINLSEKKQTVAEQLGLSHYVEKSVTDISPSAFEYDRLALSVVTINANDNEVIQNFIVFKKLEEFISLFNERFYSEFGRGNKIKHSGYCSILIILLLLEGKLKNKLITNEVCSALIIKYASQNIIKYNVLQVLSDEKLITIANETLVLTEDFFRNIQKGEAEVALKFTANEKLINLSVPIAKLVNATSELKKLALDGGLHEYVSPRSDESFNDLLTLPDEPISSLFGDFLLLNRLEECLNDFEELDMIDSEGIDKIHFVLLFIKAHFALEPINIQICCNILTSYDNKPRTDQYISSMQGQLIHDGILQTSNGEFQELTEEFLGAVVQQQAEIFVLIQNNQQKISIQPFVNKLLELYPHMKLSNASIQESQTNRKRKFKNKKTKKIQENLEIFILDKKLVDFRKEFESFEPEAQNLALIVLFFIEGYIRGEVVSNNMCNDLLSKKGCYAAHKVTKLINQGMLCDQKDDQGHQLKLNTEFLDRLKLGFAEISVLAWGENVTMDLKRAIIKLLDSDEELKKLALTPEIGLARYVVFNSEPVLNLDHILIDGTGVLDEILFQNLNATTPEMDILDQISEMGTNLNDTSNFLNNISKTLELISNPPQQPLKTKSFSETDLDEPIENLFYIP